MREPARIGLRLLGLLLLLVVSAARVVLLFWPGPAGGPKTLDLRWLRTR